MLADQVLLTQLEAIGAEVALFLETHQQMRGTHAQPKSEQEGI